MIFDLHKICECLPTLFFAGEILGHFLSNSLFGQKSNFFLEGTIIVVEMIDFYIPKYMAP